MVIHVFGELGSERLPAYHRMDVRATRHFTTRHGRLSVFLDVFNVYNRRNTRAVDFFIFTEDAKGHDVHVGTQQDELLPRLPSFGVIWEL